MRNFTKLLVVLAGAALLAVGLTPTAGAQPLGEQAVFNLTEPLDVAGTVLQPGDYLIKVVQSRWNRNLLQVWSADETKLYTTFLTVPHPEGPGGAQVEGSRYIYYPASSERIRALRTWFAGLTPSSGGHDVVYPKARAMELAALANEPVVAVEDNMKEEDYEAAELVVVTPAHEVKPYQVAVAPKPAMPEAAPAEPVKVAGSTSDQERLPQTASNIPLTAGLGLLSLLGAIGVGVLVRRLA